MIEKISEKEYLIRSIIDLLTRYDLDDVTVKMICANCHTSTRTYYNYFRDKNDIVAQAFYLIAEGYYKQHEAELSMHDLLMYMAEMVCRYSAFFKHAFAYKGQNNIRFSLVHPLRSLLERFYQKKTGTPPDAATLDAMSFFVRGMLAYVEERISMDRIPSAIESVAVFENGMPEILKQAFV